MSANQEQPCEAKDENHTDNTANTTECPCTENQTNDTAGKGGLNLNTDADLETKSLPYGIDGFENTDGFIMRYGTLTWPKDEV